MGKVTIESWHLGC